jgi:hypothetical protein
VIDIPFSSPHLLFSSQTICLRHLISSALPQRHVILGIVRNLEEGEPILPMTTTSSKSDRDIIEAIRLSLKDVRREWDQKIEKLTNAIADLRISSGLSETVTSESAVFDELLDLFTQSHTAETYPPPTKQNIPCQFLRFFRQRSFA